VLDAHQSAPENTTYELKNLAIRYFECEDWARLKKQALMREEKERLLAIAVAGEEIMVAQQAMRLQESQAVQRQQREFINNQFYNETCAGAETRILQLQQELYGNFALDVFFDSIKAKTAHLVPVEVYTEEEDAILCIENATGWRNFHKQRAQNEACCRDAEIECGKLRLNKVHYEKGISFKCICDKWVHPVNSHPACVDVWKEQMNPVRFERMVEDGARSSWDICTGTPIIMLCGLCSNHCIFCHSGILQTQASQWGCCYLCFRDVPGKIAEIQARKRNDLVLSITRQLDSITQVHAGHAFRGFVDFATEHRIRQEIEQESQVCEEAAISSNARRALSAEMMQKNAQGQCCETERLAHNHLISQELSVDNQRMELIMLTHRRTRKETKYWTTL
jgi:hypothetical protein